MVSSEKLGKIKDKVTLNSIKNFGKLTEKDRALETSPCIRKALVEIVRNLSEN